MWTEVVASPAVYSLTDLGFKLYIADSSNNDLCLIKV